MIEGYSPVFSPHTQVHGHIERSEKSDGDWFDHVHLIRSMDREDPCQVFTEKPVNNQHISDLWLF